MQQKIEAPNDEDIDYIARMIIYAASIAEEICGAELDGGLEDLSTLQRIIDANWIEKEATQALQALGLAFGKVFANHNPDYDFCMVEDEYGRDPALRYRETSLLAFPQTMISKRIEDGESVDIRHMYDGLQAQLARLRDENYRDD